jgi:hypothetical protein
MEVRGMKRPNSPSSPLAGKRYRAGTHVVGAVIAACIIAAGGAPARAASLDAATQISGSTPFGSATDCGYFPSTLAGASSTLFVDSELEPWLAVNPSNPDNIVATWQQDRWSDGGARGLLVGTSLDGGNNWLITGPSVTDCTGGPWERASDPWVSFGPNGTLYHMSLAFQTDPPDNRPGGFGPNGMVVSVSEDGGLTWSTPVSLIEDSDPRVLNDKNSITADPAVPGYAYAVWDRLQLTSAQTRIVPNPMELPRHLGIYYGVGYKGPALFSRTTDGGATWSAPRVIYDPGASNQTINNQVVVLPDGTLLDLFTEILNFKDSDHSGPGFSTNLALVRSTDKGKTFTPRGQPIRVQRIFSSGAVTPDTGYPVRDASILFDVAVDRDNGNVYMVWQDTRFNGMEEVAFSMSSDGGSTWSAPIRVNQTPANAGNALRGQAFIPSVAVDADGIISVTYYDFRNDVDGPAELTDFWNVFCDPNTVACADPANWTPGHEVRVTQSSFDITNAPDAGGYFLGDYQGLAGDGESTVSAYARPHGADPDSIFFARTSGP